ncbi:hypothetical protein HPB52_001449 [Rhipicephalus sanguineus]|uniref:Fucosyltransferase n=1 Tax=Rhipicephalus sanguineus TaxID=34632 RepID=A0A9D4T746_RHISA|nr:hypothetical protein HPB52_001449 [Rhipicephalus sanguineus]
MAAKDFYFVFVLETSPCFHHPMEMISAAFKYNIVPIYFGKTALGDSVPQGSVYDTSQEPTAFDIVDKLNVMRDDVDTYLSYFAWKEKLYQFQEHPMCALCDALYASAAGSSATTDILSWWRRRPECDYVIPSPGGPIINTKLTPGSEMPSRAIATDRSLCNGQDEKDIGGAAHADRVSAATQFTLATTWRTRLLHIRRRCERVFRENRKASYVRAAFQLAKEWSDVLPFISMLLLTGVSAFVPLMVMRYWKDVVEESRRGIPWRPWYERDLRSNGSMDDEADNPRILAWAASAFHWEPEEPTPTSDERLLERCSVRADQSPCFITRDRNYLRRADAILFDTSSVNYRDVPTYRHKGQVWVILDRGQPLKEASNDLRLMTAEFNWTMSQRDDADVIVPYRSWTTVPSNKSLDNFNRSFKSKPRASLWLEGWSHFACTPRPAIFKRVPVSQLPKSHWLPWKEREECGQASRLRILLWSPSLHRHGAETLNNSESHIDSLDKGCHVTEDRGLVYHSDAIVFDANSFRSDDFPTYRHQGQAWVFWATDSPDGAASRYLPRTAPPFNWTMGFRQDADIVLPYRIWTRIAEPVTDTQHDLPSVYINKTKNAVWLISECEQDELEHPRGPENSRWRGTERFVKELLDEMYVDLIPKCGAEYCSSRDECLSIFQEAYFFIFVMESSPCFQHPAEMIYDALKYTIVPVYFGFNISKTAHAVATSTP